MVTPCECGDPATCIPSIGLGTCYGCRRLRHIKHCGGRRYGNWCRECLLTLSWGQREECVRRIKEEYPERR